MSETIKQASTSAAALDPTEAVEELLRSLRTHREGLGSRGAQRRLAQCGPSQLERREGVQGPRELARQLTHPLALLCGWRRCCRSSSAASRSVSRWC